MAFEINASHLTGFLEPLYSTVGPHLVLGTAAVAEEMEAYAKQNAPWTDRTGNARRTLSGFVMQEDESTLLIGLAGHMPYSPQLELNYAGKYKIILPTVDSYAPKIMSAVVAAALQKGGLL